MWPVRLQSSCPDVANLSGVGGADGGVEAAAEVPTIWSHKSVWKRCPPDPLFFHKPIIQLKTDLLALCASPAAKLISGLRCGAHVWSFYTRDHFILLWRQLTNMQNLQAQQRPHARAPPVPTPGRMAAFPLKEEEKRRSGSVEQCVLTS